MQKLSIFIHFINYFQFQSKFHLIVNNLHRMFVENSNLFDLQLYQIKLLFSYIFDTYNFKYVFIVLKFYTNSHYVIF